MRVYLAPRDLGIDEASYVPPDDLGTTTFYQHGRTPSREHIFTE